MRIACKLCLSVLFFLCFLTRLGAQNLVQNPSFENVNANCSGFTGAGYINLYNWYNPDPTDTCSTPDWFATCLSTLFPTHAPNSQLGNQNPRTGQAYAGFIGYDATTSGYREYVEGELSTPLTAGVSYCVTFYVSLADNSPYAINRIGMYLSNSLTQFTVSHCTSTVPLPYTPQLQWAGTPITDKVNWVKLQWQYVAAGGEKYFTIGNFFNNAGTTVSNVSGGGLTTPFAYYFIDDVSIMPGPCCNNDIAPAGPVCASAPAFTLTPDSPGGTWSGAGITNSVTGLFDPATAGTGTHVVTYSLACGAGTTAIVVNPCALTVCKDGSNNLTVSGGTGPYNWQSMTTYTDCSGCPGGNCIPFFCTGSVVTTWSTTTANTPSITAPGSLPVRVIDNAGNSYTITSLSALSSCTTSACPTLTTAVASQTNVNCYGASTGSATVNTSGGTGPYTYTWSPGNLSGPSQSGLTAGTYSIAVKDANGCPGTFTVTITQPASALSAALSGTTSAGCGQSNGSATVTASGGTAGYTYSWSPSGGTAAAATGLAAGSYTAIITDSKGCTASAATLIGSTGGPTLSVSSQTNVSCFGGSNGAATVSATGGTGPYTYTWSPGNLSGASQTSLGVGTYTISVKDAGNCIGSTTVAITQPAAVSAAITATVPTNCGQSVGGATVTASGGTPGYTYSWSPSGGTAAGASGLAAGNYTVTVTDSKGCIKTAGTLINSAGGPTVTVSSQTNIACFGDSTGAAAVSATGGSGTYTYTWSPSGGSSFSASGLPAGTYTVTVSDGSCPGFAVVTLTQSPSISAAVSTTAANCAASDGSASVTASGGTGALSYLWSTGSATTTSISNLAPGAYTVTVTDSKGCTQTASGLVTVNNGSFAVDAGTSTTIETGGNTVLHGTGPAGATYSWTPSSSLSCSTCQNPTASPDVTTTYTLIVTNSSGCSSVDTVTIIVRKPCGDLFVPTAFSPNNDGQNDVLLVMGNCVTDLEFAIFDRWGEKVFESSDVSHGWDGTYNGKKMDPAVFAYYLNATIDGEKVSVHGSITLVK